MPAYPWQLIAKLMIAVGDRGHIASAASMLLVCGIVWHLGAGLAHAADLGGDCCEDLEARVAELEATTVGKGNRKVSVTLSGYYAQQLLGWDDGVEQNLYLSGMGPTQATNFRLNGQAQIAPGWATGYMMRVQDLHVNPFQLNQIKDDSQDNLKVQFSYWYVNSQDYGKLAVGLNAQASKSAAMYTDQSGTQLMASDVLFDGAGFFLRSKGELLPITWGQLGYCYSQSRPWGGDCNGIVMSGIRYDSPVYAGFMISASVSSDDVREAALRFNKEIAGFKIALGTGYSINPAERIQSPAVSVRKDSDFFQAGGYIEHLATGLFVHGDYGREDNNDVPIFSGLTEPNSHQWYVKTGIRKQWASFGHTVLYGEGGQYLDQIGPAALNFGITSSDFSYWGLGAVQEIDSAAMSVWLKYRKHQAAVTGGNLGNIDDIDFVAVGSIINF
jgi:hypothetical protein